MDFFKIEKLSKQFKIEVASQIKLLVGQHVACGPDVAQEGLRASGLQN
jgi:hypothetical protein